MDATELRTWRKARQLTQTQMADLLGVDLMTVNRWERGHQRAPGHLLTLALRALACDLADMKNPPDPH